MTQCALHVQHKARVAKCILACLMSHPSLYRSRPSFMLIGPYRQTDTQTVFILLFRLAVCVSSHHFRLALCGYQATLLPRALRFAFASLGQCGPLGFVLRIYNLGCFILSEALRTLTKMFEKFSVSHLTQKFVQRKAREGKHKLWALKGYIQTHTVLLLFI